jgi:hypothetical protein
MPALLPPPVNGAIKHKQASNAAPYQTLHYAANSEMLHAFIPTVTALVLNLDQILKLTSL